MLRLLNPHVAHSTGGAVGKTAFNICVSPEAEAEIKTCHLGQLNLHELIIKAKNTFIGIYYYVLLRRIPLQSCFVLNCQNHYHNILQQLHFKIKTLRLSWLICCARKKPQEFLY